MSPHTHFTVNHLLSHLPLHPIHTTSVCTVWLKQVFRQLHALVTMSLNLQYCVKLAAEGLVDGPPVGPVLMTTEWMDLLLEWCVAWHGICPRRHATLVLVGHCHVYNLMGGMFAKAPKEFNTAQWLVALWLPSNTADKMHLVVNDLGMRINDFTLDPTQDLIVLLEHQPVAGPAPVQAPPLQAQTSASTSGCSLCICLPACHFHLRGHTSMSSRWTYTVVK